MLLSSLNLTAVSLVVTRKIDTTAISLHLTYFLGATLFEYTPTSDFFVCTHIFPVPHPPHCSQPPPTPQFSPKTTDIK